MKDILSIVAGIITAAAAIPYILDILKGKTKLNVVSWLNWTLLLGIATGAAFAAHETRTAFLTLGDTIGTGLTLLLGLKYGLAKFSWIDGLCQAGAILGLILWAIFNSPAVAIAATLVVDIAASIPTLRHSWIDPTEETWVTFGVIAFASLLTLGTLVAYNLVSLGYPVYLLLINLTTASIILYRRPKVVA